MPKFQTKKFWLIIDGKIVTDHKIEAYTFGKLLTNLQKIVDIINQTRYNDHPKRDFKLFLTEYSQGSVAVAFQPSTFATTLDESMVFDGMVIDFQSLITDLIEDTDVFQQKIDKSFADPSRIIRFLESFRSMLSKKGKFNVKVGYAAEKPENPVILPSHRDAFLEGLISEYYRKSAIEIQGVLTRIKGDDPRYFTIKTLENETIKCYYPVDWEKDIVAFFKSTVTVKGVMSKKARAKEMEAVKDIQAFTSFSLDSLDEYIFKQPITFRVSYDEQDDLWCLANEELSLAGFGPSFDEARSSLKDSLDSLIVEFLAFDDSTLTEKAKKIKKNLQNYLDLNEYQEQKGELTIGDQHAHKTA